MLKLHNKRGFAVIFDWIFSLVAGVLIFSFLIYFAIQHTDLFGKVTARVVAEELDVLFSGYETIESRSVLDFGKDVELGFKCDMDDGQRFTINNQEGKNLWGKIIFSPENLKNDKINVATMSWDVPFRVTNFVYLWDKKYNLDDEPINLDIAWFPPIVSGVVNIKFVEDSSLASTSRSSFICSTYNFKTSDNKEYDKVVYYDKNPSNSNDFRGYVCFKDDEEKSYFYGEAMMLGAVFVENKDDFECVKEIAADRLKIVNDVYINKISKLNLNCDFGGNYNRAKYESDSIKDVASFDTNLNFNAVDVVETSNDRLISEGCASVY